MDNPVTSRPHWDRVIRTAEQLRLIGLGRTKFYDLAKESDFPKEIVLGKRARGRWLSELIAYIEKSKRCDANTLHAGATKNLKDPEAVPVGGDGDGVNAEIGASGTSEEGVTS